MSLSGCGKSYATEDDAGRSKRALTGVGVPVQCWIREHGWHVASAAQARAGGGTQRRSGLRQRSRKQEAVYVERRQLVAGLLEYRPWCEIRWDGNCTRRSTDVHEPGMRSRGADILDEDACITACRHCHDQVHAHPAEATARGFMVPSRPVSKPWPVAR